VLVGRKKLRPTRTRDKEMKKKLFAILVIAMCLNLTMFASCKDSNKGTETEVETEAVTETEVEAEQALLVTPDLTFFQLHGPVKKLTWYKDTYEFDKDGNLTKMNGKSASNYYHRDSKGRIDSEGEDGAGEIYYHWDSEKLIGCTEEGVIDWSYTYDDRGFIVKKEAEVGPGEMSITTYTYDKIDEFGNWVSRKIDNAEEVRKIEYYDQQTDNTDLQEQSFAKDGFDPKLELEIIGHPKYAKVIFFDKYNEEEGYTEAKGMLYDKSGNLVETLYGENEFSASGPIYNLKGKESVNYETIMGATSFSIGEKEYDFKVIKWY